MAPSTKDYWHCDCIRSLQSYSAFTSRVTVLKSKSNSYICSKYIISLALCLGTLMLFWQMLKVSAIYRPVQKLTGIKFLFCASLMPFFFCNQGSKCTHTHFLQLLPKPRGCCSLPFLQGFTETRHFLTKGSVILKDWSLSRTAPAALTGSTSWPFLQVRLCLRSLHAHPCIFVQDVPTAKCNR